MTQKKLGFGFMRLPLMSLEDPASVNIPVLKKMVDTFLARGFTYFDTAYMYHDFKSEMFLREVLVKCHPRDSFTVASKMPTMLLKSQNQVTEIFEEQLEKCGVDYFDYYLLHNLGINNYATAEKYGCFEFIQEKKAEGKIKHIGFSYHDSADLLEDILSAHPEIEFVQLQLNYLDWESESIQSRRCYEVATNHGIPVIVMEPVKGGTLAEVPKAAETLLKAQNPHGSMASWALRFAASLDNVMMVLSGMSDMDQLLDNISYMENFLSLSEEEEATLWKAVDMINASIAIPCTACGYCVEGCPQKIAIPKYFSLYNAEIQSDNKGFSTHSVYFNNLIKDSGKPSDCIECGQCEEACPQHLSIMEDLKQVAKTFEAQ